MKKILLFLAVILLFPAVFVSAYAQRRSFNDPEKIYLFDSQIHVHKDGIIQVTENITLNVRHEKIRRGIYRDIPVTWKEKVTPQSLIMDGKKHPFFTEKSRTALRVNFGDDNYIPKGVHRYSFTYTFAGAVDSHEKFDELYWNVTGNDWNFPIDKVRVQVTFPPEVTILQDGISLYTGHKGSKENHTVQKGILTYETTRAFSPQEGLTIAVPFEKGVIAHAAAELPHLSQWKRLIWSPLWAAIIISLFLLGFYPIAWLKVGRDPFLPTVPQYEPPRHFSPAFIHFLDSRDVSSTTCACTLLHLALKGYISIQPRGASEANLTLLRKDIETLPEEEQTVLKKLFPHSEELLLKPYSAHSRFNAIECETSRTFTKREKPFYNYNKAYVKPVIWLMGLLGLMPALASVFSIIMLVTTKGIACDMYQALAESGLFFLDACDDTATLAIVLPAFGALVLSSINVPTVISLLKRRTPFGLGDLFGIFILQAMVSTILLVMQANLCSVLCQVIFVLMIPLSGMYAALVRNLTPQGKELFTELHGFKHYLRVAEINRVAASNPEDAERIFCDYLPYAFALGLKNKWIQKFRGILSQAALEKCLKSVGGTAFLERGFTRTLNQAGSPKPSSSSSSSSSSGGRSSGSFGHGSSGGGHGGGGGGGR